MSPSPAPGRKVGADGSLRVRRHNQADGGLQDLPAGYVAEHVQMAYASTVHGAQGRTVDPSQPLTRPPERGRQR